MSWHHCLSPCKVQERWARPSLKFACYLLSWTVSGSSLLTRCLMAICSTCGLTICFSGDVYIIRLRLKPHARGKNAKQDTVSPQQSSGGHQVSEEAQSSRISALCSQQLQTSAVTHGQRWWQQFQTTWKGRFSPDLLPHFSWISLNAFLWCNTLSQISTYVA